MLALFLSLCSGCPCWPCFSLCVQDVRAGLVSLFVFRMSVLALFLFFFVFRMTVLTSFLIFVQDEEAGLVSFFVLMMTVRALLLPLCSG